MMLQREAAKEVSEIGLHAGMEALATIVRICDALPTIEMKSIGAMLALAFLKNVIDDSAIALGPQLKGEIDQLAAIFAKANMGEHLKAKAEKGDFDA